MADDTTGGLDTVKEELKAAIAGRFASPFLGAFTVSWLVWNHRLVFVLFSGMAVADRFQYIDEKLYPTLVSFLVLNIGGPLVSALAYIFLLPYPTEWVHKWNLNRKLRLRYAELHADGHRLLTASEADAIRAENVSLKNTLNKRRGELAREQIKVAALSMKNLERRSRDDIEQAYTAYLLSQPFVLESSNAQYGSKVVFRDDGSLEIGNFPGNIRWAYSDQKVHLFDSDAERGKMGFLEFNQLANVFEGILQTFNAVKLRGVYHSTDFK